MNKLPPDDVDFIKNVLRKESVKWKGRRDCLQRARKKRFVRKSKAGKPIYKFYWQCAMCKIWFRDEKDMEVDHIHEVGSFCGDWNEFLYRLFPPVEMLQCLCVVCHLKKTTVYNSARSKWKRKK